MKLALITPAYGPDRPLLDMACAQVDEFAPGIAHVIVISRKEASLFRHLESPQRTILFKEDVLPGLRARTYLRFRRREAFVYRTRPVGGWIVQQLIKLAAPSFCDADAFVFLDSDVFLIRPPPPNALIKDGQVRLLRRRIDTPTDDQSAWHRTAARLLGFTPAEDSPQYDYVGPLVTWRRDFCLGLRGHLEEKWKRPMPDVLAREQRLSEYTLYGLYADRLAHKDDARFRPEEELCLSTWSFDRNADMATALIKALRPHHCAVNLQSNLRWPAERYAATLEAVMTNANKGA